MTDSSYKTTVIVDSNYVLMRNVEYRGKYHWKFLDQKVFSFCKGIIFPRHHYLYSSFNEKVKQLTTGGFISHYQRKFTKHRNITEKLLPEDPKKLDVLQLSIGFQIWLIMLGISFAAFIGEIFYYWGPKIYHMLIFYITLKSFYKFFTHYH